VRTDLEVPLYRGECDVMRLRGEWAARLQESSLWLPAIAAATVPIVLTQAGRYTSPELLGGVQSLDVTTYLFLLAFCLEHPDAPMHHKLYCGIEGCGIEGWRVGQNAGD